MHAKPVQRPIIAVIGGNNCTSTVAKTAYETGREIARAGCMLICGGLGGVMEAAARGAKEAGGCTIGILPGTITSDANPFIDIPVATAMSHARNAIIVRTADGVIAVGGKYGTLSEIALALALGKPVVGLGSWDIKGVIAVNNPKEAIALLHVSGAAGDHR
jgi:uncharacterized protein (TIGR00725 family)